MYVPVVGGTVYGSRPPPPVVYGDTRRRPGLDNWYNSDRCMYLLLVVLCMDPGLPLLLFMEILVGGQG